MIIMQTTIVKYVVIMLLIAAQAFIQYELILASKKLEIDRAKQQLYWLTQKRKKVQTKLININAKQAQLQQLQRHYPQLKHYPATTTQLMNCLKQSGLTSVTLETNNQHSAYRILSQGDFNQFYQFINQACQLFFLQHFFLKKEITTGNLSMWMAWTNHE